MIDDVPTAPPLPDRVRKALRAWRTSRQRIGHSKAIAADYQLAFDANTELLAALAQHPEVLAE